jgi:hypothetical protein
VWTQQQEQGFGDARFNMAGQVGRAFTDPARHVFLVKVSRWIGR